MPLPRLLLHLLLVRPFVHLWLGLRARHRDRLPQEGPAILVCNHNSHLDPLIVMSLLPLKALAVLRPTAAADYYFRTPLRAFFARLLFRLIPIRRLRKDRALGEDPLAEVHAALDDGAIVLLFAEGTRGEPPPWGGGRGPGPRPGAPPEKESLEIRKILTLPTVPAPR